MSARRRNPPLISPKIDIEDFEHLEEMIQQCEKCEIARPHGMKVIIRGNSEHPQVLFVGEAPWTWEEKLNAPFVGPAGQLLQSIINEASITSYAMINVVKCKPPVLRPPSQDEIDNCAPFLETQILSLKPSAIVALGRVAAERLLQRSITLNLEHGRVTRLTYRNHEVRVLVTYHPSYAKRNPRFRDTIVDDLMSL